MQRRKFMALTGAAVLGTAGFNFSALAQSKPRTIKMASIGRTGSPWHKGLLSFKETVEAESGGRYIVNLYMDGALGDIPRLVSQMQLGTVDLSYFGAPTLSYISGGEFMNVAYVPYLFKSTAWAEKIFNNDEFNGMYDDVANNSGVRMIGAWGQRSPRAIQTTKGPIMTPADLKGLRIRVPAIPLLEATFKAFGSQVTPMSVLEIYNALSRGAVDGQDNGFDLSIPPKFHEVAKFWSATDHTFELVGFFGSERFWKNLSADDRDLFLKATRKGGGVTTEMTRQFDIDSLTVLKEAGVQYVVPDIESFKKSIVGIEDKYEGDLWPKGMVDKIRKLQA